MAKQYEIEEVYALADKSDIEFWVSSVDGYIIAFKKRIEANEFIKEVHKHHQSMPREKTERKAAAALARRGIYPCREADYFYGYDVNP